MAKKATGQFGLRMTPEEITEMESRAKAAGMTRSAWAKRRLLSGATDEAGAVEIARQFNETRDLIREKNETLARSVGREMRFQLGEQASEIRKALDVVAAAVKNAGDRARQ